ncbi:MAG: aminotransferase class I/II-fold pyridoxal phosphate-dependent enzyme [Lysobacterales bacterium]
MTQSPKVEVSQHLTEVRYEIRGALARRAQELDRQGYEVLHLNIGNPGRFGFRTPETMRLAIIENLSSSEAYCHQKGIFPAREAVVMQQQNRGVMDVTVDDVIMGNGVSELIDLHLRALLNPGDEVLVPSPDYPLWTAAVALNGGKAVHYPCPSDNDFQPDLEALETLLTPKTRALVVINPNNPTGAVYPADTLAAMAKFAERHHLVLMSDEIYDQVLFDDAQFTPMATLAKDTLCISFGGLSKVYRACGYRVGWSITSGDRKGAQDFLIATEMLASLRLCSNVPGQWAVQTALGGYQSVHELTRPGGRLYESRRTAIQAASASPYLNIEPPAGALYVFPVITGISGFDDHQFAMRLLEEHHVLVVPGSSFHYPKNDALRLTILPDPETLTSAFDRIGKLLDAMASE